jgi:hypothetical protein
VLTRPSPALWLATSQPRTLSPALPSRLPLPSISTAPAAPAFSMGSVTSEWRELVFDLRGFETREALKSFVPLHEVAPLLCGPPDETCTTCLPASQASHTTHERPPGSAGRLTYVARSESPAPTAYGRPADPRDASPTKRGFSFGLREKPRADGAGASSRCGGEAWAGGKGRRGRRTPPRSGRAFGGGMTAVVRRTCLRHLGGGQRGHARTQSHK